MGRGEGGGVWRRVITRGGASCPPLPGPGPCPGSVAGPLQWGDQADITHKTLAMVRQALGSLVHAFCR